MSSPVTLVIFEGGLTHSPFEKEFRQIRQAIVIDQIVKAQYCGIDQVILCTPYSDLAERAGQYGISVEHEVITDSKFHFGERLLQVVKEAKLEKVLYMGGASAPLISANELAYIIKALRENEGIVTANNFYSADIVGFTPANILKKISLPHIDNSLPTILKREGELDFFRLERSLGLNFDLDTPNDLLILAVHPRIGPHTKVALENISIDVSRCNQIKEVINDPFSELVVSGRVGSLFFKYLDENTRCRVRLYSEERGMRASGRESRGEVVSLMATLIEKMGYEKFFEFLPSICQAAVLDTRVFFSHFGWELSTSDRFSSDLGLLEQIKHKELRKFTEAAFASEIPILLGGHSLVTGGIWALMDASYNELCE